MKRKWASLACDWYLDGEIAGIAAEHDAVLKVWPILVALSKSVSHHERNPEGRIEITRSDLMHFSKTTGEELQTVLDELDAGDLIEVEADGRHALVIGLASFSKWQTATGSAADRKRAQRERDRHASVTQASQGSHAPVTGESRRSEQGLSQDGHVLSRETETDKETETEKDQTPSGGVGEERRSFGSADAAMQRLADAYPETTIELLRVGHAILDDHGETVLRHAADITLGAPNVTNAIGYLRSVAKKTSEQITEANRAAALKNLPPCETCDALGMIEADGGGFMPCPTCKPSEVSA